MARDRQKRREATVRRQHAAAQAEAKKKQPASTKSIAGMRARNDFPACLIGGRFWNANEYAIVTVIDADRDHVRFYQGDRERRVRVATFVALVA